MTTTMTFYARGDSSSANNAALNVSGTSKTPTTLLTFTSGTSGDLRLDPNGGLADPDTWLILNGQTLTFTVQFSGTLPTTNKLANIGGVDLRGKTIVVITASNGQRYFFLTDGSGTLSVMTAFPNGAIPLLNINTTTPVFMCFAAGTAIATPKGPKPVETLRPGDLVLTADGRAVPLLWASQRTFTTAETALWPDLRPVVIPAHLFGPGLPARTLTLSPCHRIALAGWQVELISGEQTALVPARHLVGHGAWRGPAQTIAYHHLYLDRHDVILSENLPSESFQPTGRCLSALETALRRDLEQVMPLQDRPDAAITLKSHESLMLLSRLLPQAKRGTLRRAA